MAMDINNGLGPLAQGGGKAAGRVSTEDSRNNRAGENASSSSEDRVEISADATSVGRLAANLESQESFDAERVAEIRTAIENGEYPIDSRRLAEKFLQLESLIYQ